jgi:glycosyltransferase involved in cell wall biosynthesis
MSKRILFLSNGSVCYDSTTYFIECISHEFKELGWEVKHIRLDKKRQVEDLRALACECGDNPYDYVMDINTKFDDIKDDNGIYCIERIGRHYWHYILDHPFYHHDALKQELGNMHVLCLDRKHKKYIESAYPHIKECIVIPLAATRSSHADTKIADRKKTLIFTSTYTDPDLVRIQARKNLSAEGMEFFDKFVNILLEYSKYTQEEAVRMIIPGVRDRDIAPILQQHFFADVYLQAAIRQEIVVQLIKNHVTVTLYGHGWDLFKEKASIVMKEEADYINNGGITCVGEVSYSELPNIYADSQMSINQNPWFKDGIHDRVPLSLINGCVCISDTSKLLTEIIPDNTGIVSYSLGDIEAMAVSIKELLGDQDKMQEIADAGAKYALSHMTWSEWVRKFVSVL